MFCSVCKEAADVDATISHKNSFTPGNCQFKLESIKLHKESRNHKSAKAIVAAKNRPCETPVVKFLLTMNSETKEKLSKLFKTCHALAICNRPFTDYNWLCQLDEAKGVKIGKTYRNSESAKKFTKATAQVERKSLASAVKTAKFVSVLSDGSTNSALCEQKMFFLRYIEDGMPVVKFAASVQVERSDSVSILSAMQKAVARYFFKIGWARLRWSFKHDWSSEWPHCLASERTAICHNGLLLCSQAGAGFQRCFKVQQSP